MLPNGELTLPVIVSTAVADAGISCLAHNTCWLSV